MTIQEIVLRSLGLDEITPEIELGIARVVQTVKNFCNIDEIPEELNFTVADIVLDLENAQAGNGDVKISSVSMGDTAYSFVVDQAADTVMKNYGSRLADFRRLR